MCYHVPRSYTHWTLSLSFLLISPVRMPLQNRRAHRISSTTHFSRLATSRSRSSISLSCSRSRRRISSSRSCSFRNASSSCRRCALSAPLPEARAFGLALPIARRSEDAGAPSTDPASRAACNSPDSLSRRSSECVSALSNGRSRSSDRQPRLIPALPVLQPGPHRPASELTRIAHPQHPHLALASLALAAHKTGALAEILDRPPPIVAAPTDNRISTVPEPVRVRVPEAQAGAVDELELVAVVEREQGRGGVGRRAGRNEGREGRWEKVREVREKVQPLRENLFLRLGDVSFYTLMTKCTAI